MVRSKLMAVLVLVLVLLAVVGFSGCISLKTPSETNETQAKTPENVTVEQPSVKESNQTREVIPPLLVFGRASVTAKVLELKPHTYSTIPVLVVINTINEYTPIESSEILLTEGDEIIIEFAGTGNKSNWKSADLEVGDIIDAEIRCIDARISSRDPITKEACFWDCSDNRFTIKNNRTNSGG